MKTMSKNIRYIIASAAAVFTLGSCQDFLNTPPVDQLPGEGYYTTPAHVEEGVRGVYAKLIDIELHQYISFSEDRSDNVWVDPMANGTRTCSESSYFRITPSYDDVSTLWANWYSVINNANTVLEAAESVTFSDEAIKNQFMGELYFLRGFAHFELARMFGNVPAVDHVLSNSEAAQLKQSTPLEVISNRVIPDLVKADELLPYEDGMKDAGGNAIVRQGRADKIVAKAMLARVYMTLKGWPFNDATAKESAKTYLDEVLGYSTQNGNKYWAPTIEEWQKQFLTSPDISNQYQIFAIQHTVNNGNKASANSGMSLYQQYFPDGGSYSGATNGGEMSPIYPEALLAYEYTSHDDPRGLGFAFLNHMDADASKPEHMPLEITITYDGQEVKSFENGINCKWIPFKAKRESLGIMDFSDASLGSSPKGWPLNFPIIRLEDMMLLRAEIYVEDGQVSDAMKLVNRIRERAGIEPRSESATAEDAMEYVKTERRLEFYLEGVRWFDEIRYGEWEEATKAKFDRYMIEGADRNGVSRNNVRGQRYLLPIPFSEMSARPGLYVQNPDYTTD